MPIVSCETFTILNLVLMTNRTLYLYCQIVYLVLVPVVCKRPLNVHIVMELEENVVAYHTRLVNPDMGCLSFYFNLTSPIEKTLIH